ncbi:hypothetical protein [Streptomyces sp. NPDC050263]|uniref:hypothetical protein n=1 Tax=Streptomyces sp. NPDC050263 TaxID=3155037 RepID=UPI003427E183
MCLSFQTDTDPARPLDAIPEPILGRLWRLRAEQDPDDVFGRTFDMTPAPLSEGDTGVR